MLPRHPEYEPLTIVCDLQSSATKGTATRSDMVKQHLNRMRRQIMHAVDSMAYLRDQAKVARSSTILLYVECNNISQEGSKVDLSRKLYC